LKRDWPAILSGWIDVDFMLYMWISISGAILISLTGDAAYKYVDNNRLWFYVQYLLWSNQGAVAWKAYRSKGFSNRQEEKKIEELKQSDKAA
jgi:hypothetical protein